MLYQLEIRLCVPVIQTLFKSNPMSIEAIESTESDIEYCMASCQDTGLWSFAMNGNADYPIVTIPVRLLKQSIVVVTEVVAQESITDEKIEERLETKRKRQEDFEQILRELEKNKDFQDTKLIPNVPPYPKYPDFPEWPYPRPMLDPNTKYTD